MNSAKNMCQFHIGSSRKPQVSSGTRNHINELDKYVSCDNVSGVAFEGQICGNHLATAGTSKVFCDVASGSNVELTFEHLQKAKNLPQSQSKEQENTIGGRSNTSNLRTCSQRKKAWKEEKKRVREEEARRRMLAPKGERVRLVSQQMLGVLMSSNNEKVPFSTSQTAAPAMNEIEFPTVEESKKQRMKVNDDLSPGVRGDVHQERSRSSKVQVKLSNLGSSNSYCVQSSNVEEEVIEAANSTSGRNKKRKDPIQIDLMNLIKTQPSRHNKVQEGKGGVSKMGRWVQKRDDIVRYSGNQLDASNPERKRGKKKEVPKKKKITVLKSAILEERALRCKLRALQEQAQNVNMQPDSSQMQADITVSSSTHEMTIDSGVKQIAQNPPLSETKENEDFCVTETVLFEEVTGSDNIKRAEDLNSTEILDLTQHIQEKLSLSTDDQAKVLLQNVSDVPDNAQEMIRKTEAQEDNCTVVLSGSPKHGCTDVIQRFPVHSRRFREYCDNSLTVPLNSAVKLLLKDIVKFQDRQYHRDPVKAFAKRRYVLGFREVKKHLQLKRLKLIIIAPDLEVAKVKGGIDDTVAQLKEGCTAQGVTCLFALSRRELGFLTFRKVWVSSIGICSYEGSEENFNNVMESLTEARTHYKQQTQHAVTAPTVGAVNDPDSSKDESTSVTNQVIASLLSKLTGKSSGDGTSVFLSAIEQTTSQKTE